MYFTFKKYYLCLVVISMILALSSCNSRMSQERKADILLSHIRTLIDRNELNAAQLEIDSLHQLYPTLINKRKIAAALSDTIERRENFRSLVYCDSILPIKQRQLDSLLINFRFEKDTTYQQYGNYIYKTQRTENNAMRTYLKAYVDENADFYLISNYCGPKIQQSSVKTSAGNVYVETQNAGNDSAVFHEFNDEGNHWESLTFKNNADNGVASFIASNGASTLRITLNGKRKFTYLLDPSDRKAITESYHLWIIMKDYKELKIQIKKATLILENIKKRNIKSRLSDNQKGR